MPEKSPYRWAMLISAVIIGLSTSALLAVVFGVSMGQPVILFALLGLCIGVSAMMHSLWDWWKAR